MAIYYHGTSNDPFDHFDLSHALEGDGKVKFGYGVNVSPVYSTAANYAGKHTDAKVFYVYTVEIPDILPDNHIGFKEPVNPYIVRRTEDALGESIPDEVKAAGEFFRKYLANKLTGNISTIKKMMGKASYPSEIAVSNFLKTIGVELFTWPYNWKRLSDGYYCAVLDENKVRPIQIDTVQLALKGGKLKFVEGSSVLFKKF